MIYSGSKESFHCIRCGNCCRWEGAVKLLPDEVDDIAVFLGLEVEEFTTKYTVLTPDRRHLSLIERSDGGCVFLSEADGLSECVIEKVKPRQCRDFPEKWNYPNWRSNCAAGKIIMKKKGSLLVISGPSGVGKSTLIARVRQEMPELEFSISCTTRAPRAAEKHGVEYYFHTEVEFEDKVRNGEFLETAGVFDRRYGTLKSEVFDRIDRGIDCVLDIDVQGAMQIKEKLLTDASLREVTEFIFIGPASFAELERRLRSRATDSPEQIELRLRTAAQELAMFRNYDFLVINDNLELAANELEQIIRAVRNKSGRFTGEVFN